MSPATLSPHAPPMLRLSCDRYHAMIAQGLPGVSSLLIDLPNHGRSPWTSVFDYLDLADGSAFVDGVAAYDERARGTLQMFRSQQQVDAAGADMAVLERFGVPHTMFDRDGCIGKEPALGHVRDKVVGGLWLPGDETGDCFKFTRSLAALAVGLGVEFRFGTCIKAVVHEGARVLGVDTDSGLISAAACLVAMGSTSCQDCSGPGVASCLMLRAAL